MNIEAAQVFAEAFQGVGNGAVFAFIVWVLFDFLKELVPYAATLILYFLVKTPVKNWWREVQKNEH